jgi:hypothetical protein
MINIRSVKLMTASPNYSEITVFAATQPLPDVEQIVREEGTGLLM